jgi:hypothetical protein
MTDTVPVCGYRKGVVKVFDLAAGGKLPVGWADKPAAGEHPHELELAITSPPAKPPRQKKFESK